MSLTAVDRKMKGGDKEVLKGQECSEAVVKAEVRGLKCAIIIDHFDQNCLSLHADCQPSLSGSFAQSTFY